MNFRTLSLVREQPFFSSSKVGMYEGFLQRDEQNFKRGIKNKVGRGGGGIEPLCLACHWKILYCVLSFLHRTKCRYSLLLSDGNSFFFIYLLYSVHPTHSGYVSPLPRRPFFTTDATDSYRVINQVNIGKKTIRTTRFFLLCWNERWFS